MPTAALKTDPVPQEWSSWSTEQKTSWLGEQALPSDPATSLFSCYLRGLELVKFFHIVFEVISKTKPNYDHMSKNSPLRKVFIKVLNVFNQGIGPLSNVLANDCEYLLTHGKYNDNAMPLIPANVANPANLAELVDQMGNIIADQQAFWEKTLGVVKTIVEEYPVLQNVRPGMPLSFGQLLGAFVDAGTEFLEEYKKETASHAFQ